MAISFIILDIYAQCTKIKSILLNFAQSCPHENTVVKFAQALTDRKVGGHILHKFDAQKIWWSHFAAAPGLAHWRV